MNYFTIRRRLKVLNDFVKYYSEWTRTVKPLYPFSNRFDSGDQKLRVKVNALIPEVAEAVMNLDWGVLRSYSTSGQGPQIRFNIIHNCLLLDQLYNCGASYQLVIDEANKAIAVYEREIKKAFLNTFFNPLYWIKCLLVFILRIPFQLLSIVISDEFGKKANSKYGSIIRIAWFVGFIGLVIKLLSISADLETFGLFRKIWSYVKGLLSMFTQ